MKINTITCHDVYNHGASLQAYALMTYLETQGYEVQIIDYKPDYLNRHYKILSIDNPKWGKNFISRFIYLVLKFPRRLFNLQRKKAFDNFTRQYLKTTSVRYYNNEELKNKLPDGDVFICGSDQIWNSLHQNGRDRAFYLDFVPDDKIKIAYAASFATDTIDDKYKDFVKYQVQRLDGVGVREISGINILEEIGIKKAVNVLDPVFLLDVNQWNNLAIQNFDEKYILIYDFDKNPLIMKIAKELHERYGWKIYSINNYKNGYEDKVFKYSGPTTFVSLVKNAQYVISNSFHAVVFSLIYNKEIIVVNRNENINTRMRDLLKLVSLNDRLISEENYDIKKITSPIDYVKVNKILKENIQFSKQYIHHTINSNMNKENQNEKEDTFRN